MNKKVQIISPSDDIIKIPRQITEETKEKFENRTNLKVKYSKKLFEKFNVDKILEDIYDAYLDEDVSFVMCYKGGWYTKEVLDKFQTMINSVVNKIGKNKIKAILLGRSEMPISKEMWKKVLEPLELNIPIMCNLDLGHTNPTLSIPIGEKITIKI